MNVGQKNFKNQIDTIASNNSKFEKLYADYCQISNEIENIQKEIHNVKQEIEAQNAELTSLDITGDKKLKEAEERKNRNFETFQNIKEAEFEKAKSEAFNERDRFLENIQKSAQRLINENENVHCQFNQNIDKLKRQNISTKSKIKELKEQVGTVPDMEKSAAQYVLATYEKYKEIVHNESFLEEYKALAGTNGKLVEEMFAAMDDKELIAIADEMVKGEYVDASGELGKKEVVKICVKSWREAQESFGFAGKIVNLIFLPVRKIQSIKPKIAYGILVNALLYYFAITIGKAAIYGLTLLIILVCAYMVFIFSREFIGQLDANDRKYLNLKYYTVGYYFLEKEPDIVSRIARQTYIEHYRAESLERKNEEQQEALILNLARESGILEIGKEKLKIAESYIPNEDSRYESIISEISKAKEEVLQVKCDFLNRDLQKFSVQNNVDFNNKCEEEKEAYNGNCTFLRRDIAQKKQELQQKMNEKLSEKERLCLRLQEAENNKKKLECDAKSLNDENEKLMQHKDLEIEAVDRRENSIEIPTEYVLGYRVSKKVRIGEQYTLKELVKLDMTNKMKPVIISFNGESEESNRVTEQYYRIIDMLYSYLISTVYIGALRLEIVDRKGNKSTILNSMPIMDAPRSYDSLNRNNIINITTQKRVSEVINKIIQARNSELNGKYISEVNNEENNKRLDNMIRYVIVSMRLYGGAESDLPYAKFHEIFNHCGDNTGILPIILMSNDELEKAKKEESFVSALRDYCNATYYKWNLSAQEQEEGILDIREVSISE